MNNEIAKRPVSSMPANLEAWQTMRDQANVLVKSGFLPSSIKTADQALSIALAGKELGIGFMESIRSINVIQGKPTISPQLMLALANRTGELEDISIDANNDRCIVTIKRKKRKAHSETFGVPEATALGLIGRDNYNKQRATMFKWRALAANLRVTFPDVVLGLYTPEEMGAEVAETENGDMKILDAQVVSEPTQKAPPIAPEPLLNIEEQTEIVKLVKEKNIAKNTFLAYLVKEYNIGGWSKIKKKDYNAVVEWIIKNEVPVGDAVNG